MILHLGRSNYFMDETTQHTGKSTGSSKKLITIIIVALLLIGGGVAAYFLLNKSPKQQYFLAEKNSIDFTIDKFEEKYEPELTFAKESQEKPTESNYELSAEFKDSSRENFGANEQEEIINNSIVKIKTATDYEKKISKADLSVDLSGMFEIKGLQIGVNKHELTVQLPGTKDTILINDKDIAELSQEFYASTFSDIEEINFEQLFEQTEFLTEKDREYLQKEYLGMIYDELPEDSFTSENENIKINDKSIKAEKVKMDLSQKEVKEVLYKLFDKAEKDKKLKSIIKEQLEVQQFSSIISEPSVGGTNQEADNFVKEFENSMNEAKTNIKDAEIPNGVTSTIWIDNNLVVKREFGIQVITEDNEDIKLTVKGNQLLTDDKQEMDYDFRIKDNQSDDTLNLKARSSEKDGKTNDSIAFKIDEGSLEYTNKDTLKDGKREFDRALTLQDDSGTLGSLVWAGDAKYNKNKKNVNHEFSVDIPDIGSDFLTLYIKNNSEHKKSIKAPSKNNVKDIGKMTQQELMEYLQEDLAPSVLSQFGAF